MGKAGPSTRHRLPFTLSVKTTACGLQEAASETTPGDPPGSAMFITKRPDASRQRSLRFCRNRRAVLIVPSKLGYLAKGISEHRGCSHLGFLATSSRREERYIEGIIMKREGNWKTETEEREPSGFTCSLRGARKRHCQLTARDTRVSWKSVTVPDPGWGSQGAQLPRSLQRLLDVLAQSRNAGTPTASVVISDEPLEAERGLARRRGPACRDDGTDSCGWELTSARNAPGSQGHLPFGEHPPRCPSTSYASTLWGRSVFTWKKALECLPRSRKIPKGIFPEMSAGRATPRPEATPASAAWLCALPYARPSTRLPTPGTEASRLALELLCGAKPRKRDNVLYKMGAIPLWIWGYCGKDARH